MKIQLKYLQNRTSNIRQDYIRKRYREAINHPLIDFTMRSLYCILPIDRPNFITLSHLFMKVDLNIKVKGYYIKLLHPTNRNAYLVYCWEIVRFRICDTSPHTGFHVSSKVEAPASTSVKPFIKPGSPTNSKPSFVGLTTAFSL